MEIVLVILAVVGVFIAIFQIASYRDNILLYKKAISDIVNRAINDPQWFFDEHYNSYLNARAVQSDFSAVAPAISMHIAQKLVEKGFSFRDVTVIMSKETIASHIEKGCKFIYEQLIAETQPPKFE